jgi:hypothetical protein
MEARELSLIGAFGVAFMLGMLVWIWWRRKTVYRRELPRIYELRDLLPNPPPPGAYFCNLDKSLAEIPQKLRQFREPRKGLAGPRCGCLEFPEIGTRAATYSARRETRLATVVGQAQPSQSVQSPQGCTLPQYRIYFAVNREGTTKIRRGCSAR